MSGPLRRAPAPGLSPTWYLPLVLAVCAAAWSALTQAGYVWDDNGLLRANTTLAEPSWSAVWAHDFWYGVRGKDVFSPYYRPLVISSFLIDYQLGLQGWISHLINLALHLLNVALLIRLLERHLTPGRAAAAGLLFGLHPLQSEAVAWVSARSDLMATGGVLGTLLLLERRSPLAALPLAAAMLSKESSALFPLLLAGWRFAWEPTVAAAARRTVREWLWLLPGLLLPLLLRLNADLGDPPDTGEAISDALPWLHMTAASLLGWLSVPWPLTTGMTNERAGQYPWLWPSAAVSALTLGWLLWRAPRRSAGLYLFAALAFLPAISSILWFGLIGERYLYLPLAMLAAALAAGFPDDLPDALPDGPPRLPRGALLLGLWSVAALWALHIRLPDWADTESLWQAAIRRVPASSYVHQMLGNELLRQGRSAEALAAYDASLDLRPARRFACENISDLAVGQWPLARVQQRMGVWDAGGCRRRPGYDGPLYIALAAAGQWPLAEARLRSGVRFDPLRRDRVLKGAIALRDGDLLLAGAEAALWPEGAGSYHDQVLTLLQNRLAAPEE